MNALITKKFAIVERLADGKFREIPLENVPSLQLAPGASYALKEIETKKTPKGMVLRRKGQSLLVMLEDQQVADLSGFFAGENQSVTFYTDLASIDVPTTAFDAAQPAADGVVTQATTPVAELGTDQPVLWMESTHSSMGDAFASTMSEPAAMVGGLVLGGGVIAQAVSSDSATALRAPTIQSVEKLSSDVNPADGLTAHVTFGQNVVAGARVTVKLLNGTTVVDTVIHVVTQDEVTQGYVDVVLGSGASIGDGTYGYSAVIADASGNLTNQTVTISTQSTVIFTGLVHDDYVSEAFVFVDQNRDGFWNAGEATAKSDAGGVFHFAFNPTGAPVLAVGGVDAATGASSGVVYKAYPGDMTGALAAQAGIDVVLSPMSTLLASVAEASMTDMTQGPTAAQLSNALQTINSAFGLNLTMTETLSGDPVGAATGSNATAASQNLLSLNRQLSVMLQAASSLVEGGMSTSGSSSSAASRASEVAAQSLASLVVARAQAGQVVQLSSATDVMSVIQTAMQKSNDAGLTQDLRASSADDLALLSTVVASFNAKLMRPQCRLIRFPPMPSRLCVRSAMF